MSKTDRSKQTIEPFATICVLGFCQCAIFAAINLYWAQSYAVNGKQPIVLVTTLYVVASLVSLIALYAGIQVPRDKYRLVQVILLFAVCFRLIQLCSTPILELDLYRYMWDGIVANNGISPYSFSPNEVLAEKLILDNPEHRKVVELASKTEAIRTIVSEVHFKEYTTIYPPVSQAVFAIAMLILPDSASVSMHLFTMKAFLVLFDLTTLGLILAMLAKVGMHPGWAIAYAWSPLVVKEIANSGHLDSIAVCFTTASVYALLRSCHGEKVPESESLSTSSNTTSLIGSAILLALGTGAKLFPVILLPLFLCFVSNRSRKQAALYGSVFIVAATLVMAPMIMTSQPIKQSRIGQAVHNQRDEPEVIVESKDGLSSFLSSWRMNDVLFSFIFENARPDRDGEINRPWYVAVPNATRVRLNQVIHDLKLSKNPPFFYARASTSLLFVLIYYLLLRTIVHQQPDSHDLIRTVFLVIAAFFFLQPTQNPWYWLWAMPFVCFARNKGWLLVATCLLSYYFRFWCKYANVQFDLGPYRYEGVGCFDHCLAWLEHLAIAFSLGCFWLHRKTAKAS